jgi:hypothetical protein
VQAAPCGQDAGQDRELFIDFSPGDQRLDLLADDVAGRIIEHALGGRVAALDRALMIDGDDRIGGSGHNRAQAPFAFPQGAFRSYQVGGAGLGLVRAERNAVFERQIERFQFSFRALALGDVFDDQENKRGPVVKAGNQTRVQEYQPLALRF